MIHATAHKWDLGWEIHIDGDPVTQVTTLNRAEQQIRDYLATVGEDDTQDIIITQTLTG